jgi:hypothetical protein
MQKKVSAEAQSSLSSAKLSVKQAALMASLLSSTAWAISTFTPKRVGQLAGMAFS